MISDIIQRLRDKLPAGATIMEDDDAIIFRAPGQKPVIYNALRVDLKQLVGAATYIIETAKAVSFEKEEN